MCLFLLSLTPLFLSHSWEVYLKERVTGNSLESTYSFKRIIHKRYYLTIWGTLQDQSTVDITQRLYSKFYILKKKEDDDDDDMK